MYPIVSIIGIKIYTYTIFYYLAVIVSLIVFISCARKLNYDVYDSLKLGIITIVVSVVLSRAVFTLLYLPSLGFIRYLLNTLKFWQGGISIVTSIIMGILTINFLSKKFKFDRLEILDLISPAVILGQAIGRIGCFMAGCCYGRATNFFLGVTFNNPNSLATKSIKIHPVQIYEAVGDFLIFLFLINKMRTKKFSGEIFSLYLILYSILRIIMERFRADSLYFFIKKKEDLVVNLNIAVLLCLIGIISGFIIRARLKSKLG